MGSLYYIDQAKGDSYLDEFIGGTFAPGRGWILLVVADVTIAESTVEALREIRLSWLDREQQEENCFRSDWSESNLLASTDQGIVASS